MGALDISFIPPPEVKDLYRILLIIYLGGMHSSYIVFGDNFTESGLKRD